MVDIVGYLLFEAVAVVVFTKSIHYMWYGLTSMINGEASRPNLVERRNAAPTTIPRHARETSLYGREIAGRAVKESKLLTRLSRSRQPNKEESRRLLDKLRVCVMPSNRHTTAGSIAAA